MQKFKLIFKTSRPRIILMVLAVALVARGLEASCCSGASSGGIGRLLAHERAYLSIINDVRRNIGSFDHQATFRSGHAPHLPHWQLTHELQAMARLWSSFLPFVRLPARTQISQESTGSYLADISLGALIPLFDEGFFAHSPALSLTTSVLFPTGIAAGDHGIYEASSITSMGEYELHLSLMAQKSFGPMLLGLSYGTSLPPSIFMPKSTGRGLSHSPGLLISFATHDKGRVQVTSNATFYSSYRVKGKALPDSSRHHAQLALGYSLLLHSHLSLNTTLGAHLPFSYLGKNANADIFGQIGLRFGVF